MMNGGTGLWAEVAGYTGKGRWSFREPRPDNETCIALLRDGCRADSKQQTGTFNYIPPTNHSNVPNFYNQTLVMQSFKEHLAAFLLMRGPFAFFGYGWVGCSQIYTRPKELDADYGTPLGLCKETATGVFSRGWTKATVSLNCNTWKGSIQMKNGVKNK